ncbi:MAG TPA: hydantoinase/oxoprolinase family protein [Xanthobacteraceae bacterium]|nr:hydantoinase/oxoprolinase family protein [Xanthobacteraceae bacterium]
MVDIIGWDVGGVHLKAAHAHDGRIVRVVQLASPLRDGLERLIAAFGEAKTLVGRADHHVVTMTGELADTFASRAEGVESLAALAARELDDAPVLLYAGPAGVVRPPDARKHAVEIASANWHVCAGLVAEKCASALFIDMGSTTTDVIPIADREVVARGYTDAQRLAAGELVYTGLVRGFVMATADRAPVAGIWTTLINENFATMADVHRILRSLPDGVDLMGTADGRAKTVTASRARLARMVGADEADLDEVAMLTLARWLAEAQLRAIVDGAMLVASAAALPTDAPVVAAGIGSGVVAEVSRRLHRACVAFDDLIDVAPDAAASAAHCAPAVSLALLAPRLLGHKSSKV